MRLRPGALALQMAVLAVPPWLPADVILLKNGRAIEGSVKPGAKAGTVEVRKGDGVVVVIREEEILRVEKKESPKEEFEKRLATVPEGELEPLVELLVWARERRLRAGVKVAATRILSIDPNHELAREELGYVVFQNRWVLKSELRKREGLVFFRDEWVTQEEKARRLREELLKEFTEDLEGVASDNPYIQGFSLRKVVAQKDPAVREILAKNLRHRDEKVRMVAVGVLAKFPARKPAGGSEDAEAGSIAAELHRVALEETSDKVLKVLRFTLARFYPAESFRLALETVTTSTDNVARERAAEVLYQTLRKAYVPELCRSLTSSDGAKRRPEVHGVLVRAFKELEVDFGYDVERWLRFWDANQAKFYDEG